MLSISIIHVEPQQNTCPVARAGVHYRCSKKRASSKKNTSDIFGTTATITRSKMVTVKFLDMECENDGNLVCQHCEQHATYVIVDSEISDEIPVCYNHVQREVEIAKLWLNRN